MSFVSRFSHTPAEASAQAPLLSRLPRKAIAESVAQCDCPCQRACHRSRQQPDSGTACPSGYCASGGVATATEVAECLRAEIRQPVSALARWIVDRQVIAFSCNGALLLPLFQFDFARGFVCSGVAPTMAELTGVMNEDEIAAWFVQPNAWLHGAAPVQMLLTDVDAVLAAARADRFVAQG